MGNLKKEAEKMFFFDAIALRFRTHTGVSMEGRIYRWARLASHKIRAAVKRHDRILRLEIRIEELEDDLANRPECLPDNAGYDVEVYDKTVWELEKLREKLREMKGEK